MTCGVMGQKDWDEYLPKPETNEVVYMKLDDYATSFTFTLSEILEDSDA